jgi:DNA polymerase
LNFGQIAKVRAWVEGRGVACPDLTTETVSRLLGEEADDALGETDESVADESDADHLPSDVREALHIRHLIGSSSIKKLKAMEACVGYDGRARGLFRYHGTTPGRQTAGLFQPHNFPRGTNETIGMDVDAKVDAIMTGDPEWVKAVTGVEPVELVVGSLRHAIRAAPGRVLMSGDYSGIQARTVLALAGQHDKTALMASGADVYLDMAKAIYGREISKADTAERQLGKASVLGLGFQMGAPKFKFTAARQGIELTLPRAKGVVDVYRKEWAPQVPYLWYGLSDAAVNAVWHQEEQESHGIVYRLEDRWLVAEIPNGSTIHYFDPQPVTRKMPWSTDEQPDYRRGFTYRVEKQGRLITRDAFGGQLTENIVMKIEREMVECAKRKLEDNGFCPIMEVHDEIVCEPLTRDLDAFKAIMEDVPRWVREMQIPVHVDVWQGERYRK